MPIIGTITCPACGQDANHYRYPSQKQEHYYCPVKLGGCGAHGGIKSRTVLNQQQCTQCEEPFHDTRNGVTSGAVPTCRACRGLARRDRTDITIQPCEHCHTLFVRPVRKGSTPRFCTRTCMKLASRKRLREARKNAGAPTRFQPSRERSLAIAYAHGYRCHLCRKLIDVSRKAPHPLALTLDHLVPQHAGGDHTDANLAPAHFRCNSRRTHIGPAQLQAW